MMKKILSILCVLSLIMSITIIPSAFTAFADDTVSEETVATTELIPSSMLSVNETEENGVKVYDWTKWGKTSITFDYVIESGYNYILEFDYKSGNGNIAGYTTRISAKTVANSSDNVTSIGTQFVSLGMQASTDWYTDYQVLLNGDDLLESGGSYLAIFSENLEYSTNPAFRNFSITKVEETADYIYPQNIHYEVTPSVVDGEAVYTSGTYDRGSLTFDYVIESGYNYILEYDYKGHNWKSGELDRAPSAYTVATPNTYVNANVASAIDLGVPANQTASWKRCYKLLSGDELLACGGTYLTIMWSGLDPAANFKNFKITKVDAGVVEPTASRGVTASIENGEYVFSNTDYNVSSVTFNKVIEADKKYVIAYDYIMNATQFDKQAPSATTVASASTLPAIDVVSGAVNIGIAQKGNAASEAWKTMATIVDGNEVRSATGGDYLALHWMWKNGTEFRIKNVRVYEFEDSLVHSFVKNVNVNYVNGEFVYTGTGYTAHGITFDYEIEADTTYYLTFDYMGTNRFASQVPAAATIGDKTKAYGGDIDGEIALGVPNSENAYTPVLVKLNGNDLLAAGTGSPYLTINWIFSVNSVPINIKNVAICKAADLNCDEPYFINNMNKSVDNGSVVYTNNSYNQHQITFNEEVSSEKVYEIGFDYMGHNVADHKNSSGLRTVPSISTVATVDTKINDSSKLDFIQLGVESHTTEWKSYAPIFKGSDIIATNGEGYLAIHLLWMSTGAANFKNFNINAYDYGDVDFDGIVNGTDVTVLKKVLLGVEQKEAKYTNVNADADEITNILDLVAIKKAVAE